MKITKFSKFFLVLLLGVFLFTSCSSDDVVISDDDNPGIVGAYSNGFFVLNEGHFPDAGSVTFIADNLLNVQQRIYEQVNGEDVGSAPQSMFFDDLDRVFIVSNGANFVSVADANTFEKIDRIESDQFNVPRYGVAENGKAYITNSGAHHVTVIDLETLAVVKTIDLGNASEFIYEGENGLLYVQKAVFNGGNEVAVIDPNTDTVVGNITTGSGLNSIAVEGHFLYTLSQSGIQKFDLNANNAEVASIPLNYDSRAANIDVEDGNIYFTSGKSVYRMTILDTEAPEMPLFTYQTESAWGAFYGFEVEDDIIYVADGGDFISDSFVELYDLTGNKIATIPVGIGPNGFYFND